MATFKVLDAEAVNIGRTAQAVAARAPYVEALRRMDAGRIDLEADEVLSTVKRRLAEAAHQLGIRVRSSVVDDGAALVWKRWGPGVHAQDAEA